MCTVYNTVSTPYPPGWYVQGPPTIPGDHYAQKGDQPWGTRDHYAQKGDQPWDQGTMRNMPLTPMGEGGTLCATCLSHPWEEGEDYAQHASLTP